MSSPRIERPPHLTESDRVAVRHLVEQVMVAEGRRPLSDQSMLELAAPAGRRVDSWLLRTDGAIRGYAHVAGDRDVVAEIAAPEADAFSALLDALAAEYTERLRVWAHGQASTAAQVLGASRWRSERELRQLRRSLAEPLPGFQWPSGVSVRTFVVGADEDAWLAVNNRSFADHPDQSGWTRADIEAREREPWFDAAGFFLAERQGALVGFHWTKVHPHRGGTGADRDQPIGEVYVVGVDPSMQGKRLGEALTLVGLHHLRDQALADVMLYVDATNSSAVRLYERLGFHVHDTDVCYAPPG